MPYPLEDANKMPYPLGHGALYGENFFFIRDNLQIVKSEQQHQH